MSRRNTAQAMVTTLGCALLLPLTARATDDPCYHGVICVKDNPSPDILLEARAGYVFQGDTGPTAEVTLGFGDLGLGLPQNILFIGELSFTGGLAEQWQAARSEVSVDTYDLSGGVRAYWPTRSRFAVFGDVLLGAANHAVQDHSRSLGTDAWTFMGQLALGMELHIFDRLSLVARVKVTYFGAAALMFASTLANASSADYVAPASKYGVEQLRLGATAGLSWCF